MQQPAPHINQYLLSFRNGEESGFTYFFNAYFKSLCFFANRYVKENAAAEDIVEESFIAIWNKREQFSAEPGLRSYFYKTVYHGCLRWLENRKRSAQHIRGYTGLADKEEKDCSENMIRAESLRLLKLAMEGLPSQCQKIFFKLYIEGKTVAETAMEMRLTTSTIKNQKARGIKLLKLRLIHPPG